MSDSALRLRNRGAYSSPFSGVGVDFFPLGVPPDHSGFVFHAAMTLLHVVLSRPKIEWQRSEPSAVVQTVRYIEEPTEVSGQRRLHRNHRMNEPTGVNRRGLLARANQLVKM